MIEVHLRMSDQWPDLCGAGWLDAPSMPSKNGLSPIGSSATDIAWYCSGLMVQSIVIRPRLCSRGCAACRAFPACRSPFTRKRIRKDTPCRPAVSGLPS